MRKLITIVSIIFLCIGCFVTISLLLIGQGQIVDTTFPLQKTWVFEAKSKITATPVVHDNKVLIRTSDTLYTLDTLTGELVWSFSFDMDQHADPPIVQDSIVILSHLQGTTALELTTGQIVWEVFSTDTRVDALPVASTEKVVVIADDSILIRDINTGELLWKIQHPYARSNAVVILDKEHLYVIFRDQIRNYDIKTGELIWNQATEKWVLRSALSGILEDDVLYLEHREGGVSAYDIKEQKVLWHRGDVPVSKYPMTIYENTLFIGPRRTVPIAIDTSTGKILWRAKGLGSYDTYQKPLIFNDRVYIRGLFQKKVYALDINNGKVVGYAGLRLPDIISTNASYSLGPIQSEDLIIFPIGNKLLAYTK